MKHITIEMLSSFATKFATKITATFIKKESGKGLSTNDYTTAEKDKLGKLINYNHPNSGVAKGTYKSVTVNEQGHITAGTNPTTLAGYGITDAAGKTHTHTDIIDIARLPAGALERVVVVANDAARLAMTPAMIQTGDTVKVTSTGVMYFVKDDTKLNSETGYEVYTAGAATSVPWAGITAKPTTFAPSAHNHTMSNITDFEIAMESDIDAIIANTFV